MVTQLEESKAPGLDKICPSILKDDYAVSTYRFFVRYVLVVAKYPKHSIVA